MILSGKIKYLKHAPIVRRRRRDKKSVVGLSFIPPRFSNVQRRDKITLNTKFFELV